MEKRWLPPNIIGICGPWAFSKGLEGKLGHQKANLRNRGNALPLPLEIIEVIHAPSIGVSASCQKGLLSITSQQGPEATNRPEKRLRPTKELIVEIMYFALYKGLGLKSKDLKKYDTPLVGFDRKVVVLEGRISLPIMTKGKEVMMNFIVVNVFSSYMEILGQPWIHAIRPVLSTLHVKVKFPTEDGIVVVKGD